MFLQKSFRRCGILSRWNDGPDFMSDGYKMRVSTVPTTRSLFCERFLALALVIEREKGGRGPAAKRNDSSVPEIT